MKKIFAALLCAGLTAYAASASAQDYVNRPEWLSMKAELVKEGLDGAALDSMMARIKRQDQVIVYMDAPIKAPSPWYVYWPRHIGGDRLQRGTAFMQNNKESFLRAEKTYGVSPYVVAAIVGVETVYGRITGNFRIADALATLAFDYPRRAEYFTGELKNLFLLANEQKRAPLDYRGSFAGAMGWPQFMPSSYRKWAVDFNADGKTDLFESSSDIVGSVASFLAGHGWVPRQAVMLPIDKPSDDIIATIDGGLTPRKPLKDWLAAGVKVKHKDAGIELPDGDASSGIISLDYADGKNEYWLCFENFYVITRYNRSRMYASSVWSLAYALERTNPLK